MEGNYDKSDKLIAAIHMLCKYRTITFYHVNEIPEILFCQFVRMEYFQSLPFFLEHLIGSGFKVIEYSQKIIWNIFVVWGSDVVQYVMVKLLHSLNHALVQRAVFRFDPDIASLWKLSQEKNTDVAKIKNDMNERFLATAFSILLFRVNSVATEVHKLGLSVSNYTYKPCTVRPPCNLELDLRFKYISSLQ